MSFETKNRHIQGQIKILQMIIFCYDSHLYSSTFLKLRGNINTTYKITVNPICQILKMNRFISDRSGLLIKCYLLCVNNLFW